MVTIAICLSGLVFGSFVNAFVWRLRQQDLRSQVKKTDKKRQSQVKTSREMSILHGRSMCPECRHTLAPRDLIPVFSWLSLRGKCRYCKKPISWQYPTVELTTALLFAVSYMVWPLELDAFGWVNLVVWLIFIVFFVALAVYDFRWSELPDVVVFPLIGLASVLAVSNAVWQHDISLVWLPALSGAIFFGLFWVIYQVSNGEWIGGGDVKLAAVLGLLAGTPFRALLVLFLASLIGTIMSLPIVIRGKNAKGVHIPFGPALLLAMVIVQLFGASVVTWYQGILY